MKSKLILSIYFTLAAFCYAAAQAGTLYFVSETGDKFTLYVSGIRQNNLPAFQVEATNISGTAIPCMIVFENPAAPSINGTINRNDVDVAFVITRNAAGAYAVVQKVTPTTLSSGVTISGTTASGNTTTIKTNGGYVESVKSGQVEATDHSVKTDKFSVSSNVKVKVKTPGILGDLPDPGEVNTALNQAEAYNNSSTTTTTTTTTTTGAANAQTNPPGTFYFESEGVDSFYLWFNSRKVNQTPQMYVEIPNVIDGYINMRVEFSDKANRPCSKSMIRWGRDCYYAIQRNNKGEHIIKLKNAVGDLKTPAPQTTETSHTQTQVNGAPVSTFTITSAPVVQTSQTTVTTSTSVRPTPPANNTVAAQPVISAGPLKATLLGSKIELSDGRRYTLNSFAGTTAAAHIKVSILPGTKFSIAYADGKDEFTGTSPFDYTMPPTRNTEQFTLTAEEGSADKTWWVSTKNSSWHILSVEP